MSIPFSRTTSNIRGEPTTPHGQIVYLAQQQLPIFPNSCFLCLFHLRRTSYFFAAYPNGSCGWLAGHGCKISCIFLCTRA